MNEKKSVYLFGLRYREKNRSDLKIETCMRFFILFSSLQVIMSRMNNKEKMKASKQTKNIL